MRKLSGRTGILGVMALLASGCGGTTAQVAAGGAELVPATAPVFITVDTDQSSDQWQRIDALARKFPDRQQAIDSFKRQLTQDGLDWDDDVRPALGPELDLVLLDFDQPKSFVGLIQPRDEAAFARLAEQTAKRDPSNAVVYEKFHGWTVVAKTHGAI